jgi:hypothetical protein
MKRYQTAILVALSIATSTMSYSSAKAHDTGTDSSHHESKKKNVVVKSTARFHTKGLFSYGGRISADHPALDINLVYERRAYGLLIYKAMDVEDHTSSNNFSLLALYKNFKIGNRLTLTPHLGTFLEQSHKLAGHGSDVAFITTTAVKLNGHFTIDHTTLVGSLIIHPENIDWVNRIRLLFTTGHLEVTATAWHNNHVFDTADYASSAITVALSRLKLTRKLNLTLSVTDIAMLQSSHKEAVPKDNNIMASIALQYVK